MYYLNWGQYYLKQQTEKPSKYGENLDQYPVQYSQSTRLRELVTGSLTHELVAKKVDLWNWWILAKRTRATGPVAHTCG